MEKVRYDSGVLKGAKLQEIVRGMLMEGRRVATCLSRSRPDGSAYVFFSKRDGTGVAYLDESERWGGVFSLGTEHVPNKASGTGYRLYSNVFELTEEKLDSCFVTAPDTARNEEASQVVKWKDLDEWAGRENILTPIEITL